MINPVLRFANSITINAGYVLCQPQGNNHSWLALKNFPTKQVLAEGVVTPNACGQQTASPVPGQVIVFVRRLNFWERLKHLGVYISGTKSSTPKQNGMVHAVTCWAASVVGPLGAAHTDRESSWNRCLGKCRCRIPNWCGCIVWVSACRGAKGKCRPSVEW